MTQRRLLVPPPRRRDEHDDGDADALPEEGDPAYAPRQSFESLRRDAGNSAPGPAASHGATSPPPSFSGVQAYLPTLLPPAAVTIQEYRVTERPPGHAVVVGAPGGPSAHLPRSERPTAPMPIRPERDEPLRPTTQTPLDPALVVATYKSEPPLPGAPTMRMEMDPELLAGIFPVITRAIRTFRKPIDRWWPAPPPEPPSRRKAVALPTMPAITQRDIKTQLMPAVRDRDPAEPAYELPVSVWLRPPMLLALALAAVAVIGGIAFLAWP